MRAVVIEQFGQVPAVREVPDPTPPPGAAVLQVEATGLCRSDVHAFAGHDDTVTLPLEVFQQGFMGDAAPETAAVVHSVLRPQPYRTFTDEPVDGERYRELGVPLEYVLSTEDVALPPGDFAWSPRFPERCGTTASTVPGSHESMFTRPAELADGLLAACHPA